jgi:hypothetical protein
MTRISPTTISKQRTYGRCQFGAEADTTIALAKDFFIAKMTELSFQLSGIGLLTKTALKGISLSPKYLSYFLIPRGPRFCSHFGELSRSK